MPRSPRSSVRPELVALLATARMSPLDDAPRLVVADWLEENGDDADQARATFIRLQCEHARKDAVGRRKRDLTAQETTLLEQYRDVWLGGLQTLEAGEPRFTRGLVDLDLDVSQFFKRTAAAALASEQAAWIDELTLHGLNLANLQRFLSLPVAGRIGGLIVSSSGLDAQSCQAIAACDKLTGLHTLDLNYNSIGDEGATALASSPHLSNLSHLDMWICGIREEGARALAGARAGARPYWLNLGGNSIGEEGIRALSGSPMLENLRRFLVWGNQIGSTGLMHLVRTPYLKQIEELYLNENNLGLRGARALAGWPSLANLRTLSIWGNRLGRRGGALLCAAPMPGLRMLLIANNAMGDEGVVALANNPTLRKLEQLDLASNRITDEGVRALLDSPYLQGLENLSLSGNNGISDALLTECGDRFDMQVHDEVP